MDRTALYTVIVDERSERVKLDGFGTDLVGTCGNYLGHGKRSNGGKVTFSFNGTAVELHGDAEDDATDVVSCTLDGKSINKFAPPTLGRSQVDRVLCSASQLDANVEHTLELTVASSSKLVDVDYVLYETPYDKLRNGDVLYYHSGREDSFTYTAGWRESSISTHLTTTELSSANFTYYGLDCSLYIIGHASQGRFRGEIYIYSDTGDSFAGKAALTENGVEECPFYRYYESGGMGTGNHSIMVQYRGGRNESDNTPIEISFFTVPIQGLIVDSPPLQTPSQSSNTPNAPGPSITGPPSGPPMSRGLSRGTIAGIIVGVTVIIVVPIVMFVFWRRRSRRKQTSWDNLSVSPYVKQSGDSHESSMAHLANNFGSQGAASINLGASSQNLLPGRGEAGIMYQTQEAGKSVYHLTPPQNEAGHSRTNVRPNTEAEVFVHSDSGVRLGDSSRPRRIEVPPMYTEE